MMNTWCADHISDQRRNCHDLEHEDVVFSECQQDDASSNEMDTANIAHIKEDLAVIRQKKKSNSNFPTYSPSTDKGTKTNHS